LETDFLSEFNRKIARGCQAGKLLVLGPPRSGKTTFINTYLKDCGEEYTVGLVKTTDVEEPRQPGKIETTIVNIFKKLERVIPLLEKAKYVPMNVETEELKKLKQEDVEELGKLLGKKAPKHIVQDVVRKIDETESSSLIAYYIPWDYKPSDERVKEAIEIIVNAFKKHHAKIRWLGAEYIPPGFVKEVLDLTGKKNIEEVKKEVEEQVEAYVDILKSLDLLDTIEWESRFVASIRTFISVISVTEDVLLDIIPTIEAKLLGALAIVLTTLFANHLIKTRKSESTTMINLKINLKKLMKIDSEKQEALKPSTKVCKEFNELGKIIAYKLAIALNRDVKDVCSALAEIAGIEEEKFKEIFEKLSTRIAKVEEKIKLTRLRGITIVDKSEFAEGLLYPDIKVVDNELKIRVGGDYSNYYSVVEAGAFRNLISDLISLLKEKRVVVVVGPRGIGKSVLSTSAIWRLFESGDVELVAGVRELNENNDSDFKRFIYDYLNKSRGNLLILYDPTTTRIYEEERKRQPLPKNIIDTVDNLLEIISSKHVKNLMILVILPIDIYNALGEDARGALDQYKREVNLKDVDFLSEVVKEYSGKCRDRLDEDKLRDLASKIVEYDEGHTLIARFTGTLLADKFNCSIDDVKEIIEEAEHKTSVFIAGFINSFFNIEDEDDAKVLAEIFAIRKPFTDLPVPGVPILSPGIVKVIKSTINPSLKITDEKAYWLSIRHHDLIEHTIEKLLNRENLGKASEVWLRTRAPRITNTREALKYFIINYGEGFAGEISRFSNCWKRLALITGYALTGRLVLPSEEVLGDYGRVLSEALKPCKVDYYLLIDNTIPLLIIEEIIFLPTTLKTLLKEFLKSFDYKTLNNVVSDAEELLETWRNRKSSYFSEVSYALGLATIVSKAIELGKDIDRDSASTILKVSEPAIAGAISLKGVWNILRRLRSLGYRAPQHYITILAIASSIGGLDGDTAKLIYKELDYIYSKSENEFKKSVWPLLPAVEIYSDLLYKHLYHFISDYVSISERMCDLLSELKKHSGSDELTAIAKALALIPALHHENVKVSVQKYCSIDNVDVEVSNVLKNLEDISSRLSELIKNEYFANYIKASAPPYSYLSEETAKTIIDDLKARLISELAFYKFRGGELDEAIRLFNKAAEIYRSIGDYYNYLSCRNHALRSSVMKAKSFSEYIDIAKDFENLWSEALKHLGYSIFELSLRPILLGEYLVYLVYLASIGRYSDIKNLLNEYTHILILRYSERAKVSAKLMMKRGDLKHGPGRGSCVSAKLMMKTFGFTNIEVTPEELIYAYSDHINRSLLPALKLALGIDASLEECNEYTRSENQELSWYFKSLKSLCEKVFRAVEGDSEALEFVDVLKLKGFQILDEEIEMYRLVKDLDVKSYIELGAPITSNARFAFMLYNLVNGNEDLAKRHAKAASLGLAFSGYAYPSKLFRDVYELCCDVGNEKFRLALLKLFYYHY